MDTLVYKEEDTPACKALDMACKEAVGTQAYKRACKALALVYMVVADKLACMAHKPALVELRRSLGNGSSTLSTSMQQQLE